jgi:predicted HicB family RNase H-like nuclease
MSEKRETSQIVVRVDPALHRAFRRATFDQGISMREIVENAIDMYLQGRRSGVSLHAASPTAFS